MKYRVVVLEQVYEELNEAALYYEERQVDLGKSLVEEWEKIVISIQKNPEKYEKKYKKFRQGILSRFPYLVMFELEDKDIIIYRFIHARRHPKGRYSQKKK
jgi:hypothetical protein